MTPSQRGALMGRSSSRLSRGAINLNPSSQSLLSAGGGRLGASRRNAVSNPGGLEDWAEAGEQEEEEEEEEDEMGEEPDFSRKGGADKAGVGPRKTKLETIVSGMPGSVPMVEEVFDPDRNEEHRRQMEDIEVSGERCRGLVR